MRPVHDRSPLALPHDLWAPWLAGDLRDPEELAEALAAVLVGFPVRDAVSSARNEGPELVEPLAR